ncbi:MAG: ABC transporter substrate-binding protein [Spirochaetales bacterium]|jgi:branched-chain amino acid transport system substrate-binding protein|nr:ABC transporter substrate-binding protein [Spirochaetales bacterium]
MKRGVFVLALVLAAFLAVGCGGGQSQASSVPVKIAVALPMTGDNAEYGKSFLTAAEIMVEKWNKAGGVLGKQIELVIYDDKNSAEEAASIAQKIVSDKDIIGVLGHFSSGVSMTAAPTYQENKVIEISNCASHPGYSKIGNYIFRNNTVISAEFNVIVDVVANDLKLNKVGIIAIKTDWGNTAGGIAADLVKANPKLTLVAHEEVLETSDDHGPAIAKLKAAGAEAVIAVGMYSLYGPLARQYKEVDPKIQLLGVSNAYTQQIIQLGGDAVEGLFAPVSFFAQSDDPEVKAFVDEFKKRFGMEPSALAAQAYDSIGILLEAIKSAGSLEREKVRDAVNSISYPGITGPTNFDSIGDADKKFQKVRIQGGKFIQYKG